MEPSQTLRVALAYVGSPAVDGVVLGVVIAAVLVVLLGLVLLVVARRRARPSTAALQEPPVPLRQVAAGSSVGFEDLVLRAMSLDRRDRLCAAGLSEALLARGQRSPATRRSTDREEGAADAVRVGRGDGTGPRVTDDEAGSSEVLVAAAAPEESTLRRVGIGLPVPSV